MDREQKKRDEKQQKVLNQLLSKPENQKCADCPMRGPKWASVSIGCFLCIRCAGLHRKLGTHISKIKSINLDTWTPEWIQFVSSMGNDRVNQYYLSRGNAPAVNTQNDSDMEAFIRNKYEKKSFSLHSTASIETAVHHSSQQSPTANASTFPYSSQAQQLQTMGFKNQGINQEALSRTKGDLERAIEYIVARPSEPRSTLPRNLNSPQKQPDIPKQQDNLVRLQVSNQYDSQLQQLQTMGFKNEQANKEALNRTKGNLESAIEYIVSQPQSVTMASPQDSPKSQNFSVAKLQPQNDLLEIFASPLPSQQQILQTQNQFLPHQLMQPQFNQFEQSCDLLQKSSIPAPMKHISLVSQQNGVSSPQQQLYLNTNPSMQQNFQHQTQGGGIFSSVFEQQQKQSISTNSFANAQYFPAAIQQPQQYGHGVNLQAQNNPSFNRSLENPPQNYSTFTPFGQPTQNPGLVQSKQEQPLSYGNGVNLQAQNNPSFNRSLENPPQNYSTFTPFGQPLQNPGSQPEQLYRDQHNELRDQNQTGLPKESILSIFKTIPPQQPQIGFNNYQVQSQQPFGHQNVKLY
jgi:hypothetical protein